MDHLLTYARENCERIFGRTFTIGVAGQDLSATITYFRRMYKTMEIRLRMDYRLSVLLKDINEIVN